jgi:hypothetical protein
MTKHRSFAKRWRPFAACLAILVAITAAPTLMAQTADSEDVTVTANIVSPAALVITLCDLSANFGSELNNEGGSVTGTTDTVAATTEGTGAGQGVYYRWTPTCATGTSFIQIDSSVAWDLHQCATDGTSTSSLAIANSALKFRTSSVADYANANISTTFTPCPVGATQTPVQMSSVGSTTNINFFYYLRVDDNDTPGSFNATTTWTVTP